MEKNDAPQHKRRLRLSWVQHFHTQCWNGEGNDGHESHSVNILCTFEMCGKNCIVVFYMGMSKKIQNFWLSIELINEMNEDQPFLFDKIVESFASFLLFFLTNTHYRNSNALSLSPNFEVNAVFFLLLLSDHPFAPTGIVKSSSAGKWNLSIISSSLYSLSSISNHYFWYY